MSINKENTTPYSAADLQRYIDGRMDPAEMNALEKAALEDPFLADALEGYMNTNANIAPDLNDLRDRLTAKTSPSTLQSKRRPSWWRVAAIIVVIAGAGTLLYSLLQTLTLQKAELARQEAPVESVTARDSMAVADTTAYREEQTDNAQESGASGERRAALERVAAPKRETEASRQTDQSQKAPPFSQQPQDSPANQQETGLTNRRPAVNDETASRTMDLSALQNRANKDTVSAKLESQEEQPAISANTRARSGKVQTTNTANRNTGAVPRGGWENFDEYIIKKKKVPPLNTSAHGDVVVSFLLDERGNPVDLRIDKTLTPPHDEEAIRLLKEGPGWLPGRDRSRITITVKF